MDAAALIISEDRALVRQVRAAFEALGVAVSQVRDADEAVAALGSASPELVVCGFEAMEALRRARPGLATVLIADAGNSRQTIESVKRGAIDVLVKPLRQEDLERRLGEALRTSREQRAPVGPKRGRPPSGAKLPGAGAGAVPGVRLVGQSPAMQELYKQIGLLAARDINVLITGESGTGKELVARALVEHSRRADKPYLEVNCAAIPETLLESELFGHEKGAFTGADQRRVGRFEEADGGTLFLDEVGDMPASTQAKLLRVLQEGAFQRVGGNKAIRVDVRILAATHQPLEQMVAEKRFRQDLYYRLKVAGIEVPPLREREVDAVLLAHFFVDRLHGQGQTSVRGFAPESVSALLAYRWPGNVRELENVIKAAAVVARGPVLRPEHLPAHLHRPAPGSAAVSAAASTTAAGAAPVLPARAALRELARQVVEDPAQHGRAFTAAVAAAEAAVIAAALERTAGGLTQAAALLGISRTTLRKKIQDAGITLRVRVDDAPR